MNKFMKRTTIGLVMQGLSYGFVALLFAASCANDDVAQGISRRKIISQLVQLSLQVLPSQMQQHVQPFLTMQRAQVLP